ncbi:phage tail protein [Scytonema sp. NUACC21]
MKESLLLFLTSMQPPEAVQTALASKGSNIDQARNDLLLRPGEPGEMLVVLENLRERPMRWKLEIEGDFPIHWCRWSQEDFEEIAPNQRFEGAISFHVPENFFENQFALNQERSQLNIQYQSQIYVYAQVAGEQQLVGHKVFNLFVRPRSSYLDFLPALYREVDFVGRFLSIFEQAFDPTVQTIDTLWAYLDPLTAPEALLPFLAHWVGWEIDPRWSLQQQRRLIRNAITLYRWHGTSYGLRFYLHLYTGLPLEQINIREIFEQGFVFGQTLIGEDSMVGGGRPYHFIVELCPQRPEQIDEGLVREIIERQKPAFCTYELDIVTLPAA